MSEATGVRTGDFPRFTVCHRCGGELPADRPPSRYLCAGCSAEEQVKLDAVSRDAVLR